MRARKREKTSYRRRPIDKLQRDMKRRGRLRKGDARCQLPIANVAAVNDLTIAYSVSNSFMNVYLPWKIIRRKVKREEQNSKGFIRPLLAECSHFARSFCRHEYDVPESVVAKEDVEGATRLSPRRCPTLHGPRNNTLPPWPDQYINYLSIY